MYCILVTGIPAAGKSTMAEFLAERLKIPVISKDGIKELLFDSIGFQSREEKVKLGISSMNIMYYIAGQFMKVKSPFILENNFENSSKEQLLSLLDKYSYTAMTIVLTGDYQTIYQRFLERNSSSSRHRGHVVNDCYPEKERADRQMEVSLSYEDYVNSIQSRGIDVFKANGLNLVVDTTEFARIDREAILGQIMSWCAELAADNRLALENL